jgi:hypothetical protein
MTIGSVQTSVSPLVRAARLGDGEGGIVSGK